MCCSFVRLAYIKPGSCVYMHIILCWLRIECNIKHVLLKVDIQGLSFVQMIDGLVAPIHPETHKLALEGISNATAKHLKKAPVTGGCRVEGYVRVKKVNLGLNQSMFL